ncbi:HIT domain-containing protein [Bacteroidia bacterium]|nr:HIT domain-containing protein [Bacteroidia bacterium]
MNKLKDFIEKKMSMSHIYQPVMIKVLLENGGTADKKTIAQNILSYDFSQVEYYEGITNNMVGRVLRKNEVVSRYKNIYDLKLFKDLSSSEIQELIDLCDQKIEEYINQRGTKIWEHRRRNRKAIPGSTRYKVLKRADGRCELCGISKEEKALEVDHIIPKNNGGEDSIDNYQALCFSCNANKRDTDDTDFRNLNVKYQTRLSDCIFCNISRNIIAENELSIAFYDKFPVTSKHVLVIPKRHCNDYFELSQPEINAMNRLTHELKTKLSKEDTSITGYNIGFNTGSDAGQTVFHCHMHLIPRRKGDVENPIGGVRNLIPGKGDYKPKLH